MKCPCVVAALFVLVGCASTGVSQRAASGTNTEKPIEGDSISHYLTSIIHRKAGDTDAAIRELRKAADLNRESTMLQVQLLGAYYRSQDFENAVVMAERAVRSDPDNVLLHIWLGRIYYQLGRVDEALEAFQTAIALDPTNAAGYEALAEIEEETNDLIGAIEVYEKLLGINPESAFLHYRLGFNLLRIDEFDGARAAFERAVELDPELAQAYYLLGLIYLETDQPAQAIDTFQAFLQLNEQHVRGQMNLAAAHARLGQYGLAVDIMTRLIDGSNADTEHHIHRTFLLLKGGMLEDSGIAAPPNGAPLVGTVLQILARKATNEPYERQVERLDSIDSDIDIEASVYLNDLISTYGDEGSHFLESQFQALRRDGMSSRVLDVLLARLYLATEQSRPAAELLEYVIRRYGEDAGLRYLLASAYDDLDMPAKTEEHLRKCVELEPNDADALNFLGYFLAEQNKNLNEAQKLLEQALEADPENGFYLDSLGWIYYRKGDAKRAIRYIRDARRFMDSDDAILRDHIGDAYLLNGEVEKAVDQWRRARRLDPELEGVEEKIRKYGSATTE